MTTETQPEYRIVKIWTKDNWESIISAYCVERKRRFLFWEFWLRESGLFSNEENANIYISTEKEYRQNKNLKIIINPKTYNHDHTQSGGSRRNERI